MASYRVIFKPSAGRALRSLPNAVQLRIVAAIDDLSHQPRPPGCVKLAGGENLWRIRIGDYRVVYAIDDKVLIVTVVKIGHRGDVYRRR